MIIDSVKFLVKIKDYDWDKARIVSDEFGDIKIQDTKFYTYIESIQNHHYFGLEIKSFDELIEVNFNHEYENFSFQELDDIVKNDLDDISIILTYGRKYSLLKDLFTEYKINDMFDEFENYVDLNFKRIENV